MQKDKWVVLLRSRVKITITIICILKSNYPPYPMTFVKRTKNETKVALCVRCCCVLLSCCRVVVVSSLFLFFFFVYLLFVKS